MGNVLHYFLIQHCGLIWPWTWPKAGLKALHQLSSSLALVKSHEKAGKGSKKWHIIGVDLLSFVGATRFAHQSYGRVPAKA